MARPVIALLTDFGLRDHYVGVMKGVALSICPDAQLVDLTHEIAPQQIDAAVLQLDASYRFFPPGTVFLCVIDPGVGSERRALAIDADGYRFVGPDNGLFSTVLARASSWRAVEVVNPRYALPDVSRTFEGRDRFAPAAAWLAQGLALEALGPAVNTIGTRHMAAPVLDGNAIDGEVVAIDHFGNLITNVTRADVAALAAPYEVGVAGRRVPHVVSTYAEAPVGFACVLFGSSDRLEIAVRNGSAASRFGVGVGAAVNVRALTPA
jgi:S-adenosylmethionine hydrolase